MTAIDFPASPADGALFRPSLTGITYQFSASPSPGLWKPVQSGTSPGGDFYATRSAAFSINPSYTVIICDAVQAGNSGGWYNPSTGVYRPPAGRYVVYGGWSGAASNAVNCTANIRKNGVALQGGDLAATAASTFHQAVSTVAMVDANGTDTFDLVGTMAVGGTGAGGTPYFGAFPISGIQGPPGVAPNALQLWSETVLGAPAAQMDVTVPANARLIQLEYGLQSTGASNDNFWLRMMQSGVPITTGTYDTQVIAANGTTITTSPLNNQTAGWILGSALVSSGTVKFSTFAPSSALAAFPVGNVDVHEVATGGNRTKRQHGLYMNTTIPGGGASITGFRLYSATPTNFVTGSYMRALVIP